MPIYREWKRKLAKLAEEQVFPLTIECELTSKCNFTCSMCYAKDNCPQTEWSLNDWKQLFDEAINCGTLFFVLTGGEPLTHPHFWDIYDYLASKGSRITIFTNGSLIDELVIERFKKQAPELVVISLYGYDEESVYLTTKVKGAFLKINRAIELLSQAKIPFTVRTLPIKPIYDRLESMIQYVKSFNQFLGYQLYIAPTKNDTAPSKLRLTPEDLAEFERKIRVAFPAYGSLDCEVTVVSSGCQAMKTGCYITHEGLLRPCALAQNYDKIIRPNLFLESYRLLAKEWRTTNNLIQCDTCEHRTFCIKCPIRLDLENGKNSCSKYLKALAIARGGNDCGGL